MKRPLLALSAALLPLLAAAQTLHSPSHRLALQVGLSPAGEPTYQLWLGQKPVIKPSRLGLRVQGVTGLDEGFKVVQTDSTTHDDTWTPVWGEVKQIRNHYRELALTLQQTTGGDRRVVVRFRLFDDGLGFRYELPAQPNLSYLTLTDERTEFSLAGDHTAWWLPADYDTNEYQYTTTKVSGIGPGAAKPAPEIGVKVPPANGLVAVQTPLMLKSADGLYINIHEAAQVNYPAMQLAVDGKAFRLTSHLVPDAVGSKAFLQTPAASPWRTIVVSDRATDVLASKIILNLNDPSRIADPSFIKPQKFVGVWWEMHVNRASWDYAEGGNRKLADTDWTALKPHGRHGATTANVKRYIDFAARHGFPSVLVEGWNVGWEDWYGNWKEEVFDFVTPYPDFDVNELQQYAAAKGVKLMMHHETSGSVTNYERRMPAAYDFMQAHGYDAVKTGYVGRIIPRGEHHDGQWMSNHFVRVAQALAQRRMMVDMHESVRPTGLHRTWPNWLACEAARGNEFNAWSQGNPPEHETILPFTRLMGGPMDYTPGIFQLKLDDWNPERNKGRAVHTTLAKQLALYLTMYSPLQMAADLPEAYEKHLDAFQFIKDVPVDWDDSRYLAAEPGDYLTVARKAKGKDEWYLGAVTDEQARQQRVKLDFLPPGAKYVATIYADAPDASWDKNPMAYRISTQTVDSKTALKLALAPGGGAAVSLKRK